ncbi:hypothetical protein UFOVP71_367 [uncultured Caudovirales phage]|uniref:Uncharacterized protein n=1 Tax=uncultured Caudovirales phage TaxID=2100421 RepID=A0A6J5TC09_9CAUD|nr:hypothetical protein UFOVP71_367 [uncultured Caudovirales phage]
MITFYGDTILFNPLESHHGNRYLHINIDNPVDQHEHFTGHPQLDYSVFESVTDSVEFKPFEEYTSGKNVVAIGLHGGWSVLKLKLIQAWFVNDPGRLQAWLDPDCLILLDYSEEGFCYEVFADLDRWITDNNLNHRVLYVSSAYNVSDLYSKWCARHRRRENMRSAWYGFFPNWLLNDHGNSTLTAQPAVWQTNTRRYMCLNRRPHPHRILLVTLLERFKLLESGAVSMPRDFAESEVIWQADDWDIPYQWQELADRFNGYIDYLNADFERVYAKLPLIADTADFSINYALNLNEDFYKDYPINVISETLFFSESAFASEKIWKPMLAEQIFFVMAAPFYLKCLREMGFQTFAPYVNEDYDTIADPDLRAVEMVRSLKQVLALDEPEFLVLLDRCRPVLEHNRRVLLDKTTLRQVINSDVARAIDNSWHT